MGKATLLGVWFRLSPSDQRKLEENYAKERDGRDRALKAIKRFYVRYDEPWKLAEDRRLLRAFERDEQALSTMARGERRAWWQALAKKFGRTDQALRTRLWGLRAGVRTTR